jgi:pimeloyl-ACP methyl ester carboxylesterase
VRAAVSARLDTTIGGHLRRPGPLPGTQRGENQVVLLHATLHDHHDYDPIIDRLADRFRTIAIDWPGPIGTTGLANVLQDVIDALELPAAAFIASSVGGFATGRLAITRPDRVPGLVLVNVGGFVRQPAAGRVAGCSACRRYAGW